MNEFLKEAKAIIKRDWKTIPNILCYARLLMIPVIIYLYVAKEAYVAAAVLVIISWITDVADGFIARRFNMVSELGKALDPIADKLNQLAIFICLGARYKWALYFVILMLVKEIAMFFIGVAMLRKLNIMNSAQWHGKVATFFLEWSAMALIVLRDVPDTAVIVILIIDAALLLNSFFWYIVRYVKLVRAKSAGK